jgi:hypothetical protein
MRFVLIAASTILAGSGSTLPPALRLVDPDPLTIRGVRFYPSERVRVTVSGEVSGFRAVRASQRGTFVARFRLTTDRCTYILVRARGLRGSRASLERLTACAPAP